MRFETSAAKKSTSFVVAALFATMSLLQGCGGGGATSSVAPPPLTSQAPAAAPQVSSLAPADATAGGQAFTLKVRGSGFAAGSVVRWNGSSLATTFIAADELDAAVTASSIGVAGNVQIQVTTPSAASNTVSYTIKNGLPTIQSVSPANALVGSTNTTITVDGQGFVAASVIQWNGTACATTFVSATQLTATVPSSALASAGSASIDVSSPAPGGGTSSAVNFAINNPLPTLLSMNPPSAPAGAASVSVTVTGTGFVSGSTVEWNGAAISTTFANSTTLQILLSANELAAAGTAAVRVASPTPGGGASAPLNFAIENGVPVLVSIAQDRALAGGQAFTITATGNYFVPGSTLHWNGVALATTFVSSTQLTAAVTADKIALAGPRQVRVSSPPPSGGLSTAAVFTVDPVTSTFVYVAQPAEGLIARMVVDPITGELRPDGFDAVLPPGSGLWALQLDRSRRFLYTLDISSNRLMSFAVNAATGALAPITGATVSTGTDPVAMASHPTSKFVYVANMTSNNVSAFAQDPNTGALQPVPGSPFASGASPLGMTIDDAGKFAFVTNYGDNTISVYSIATSGALVAVPGSPFAAVGNGPWTPSVDPNGKFLYVPNYDSANVSAYQVDATGGLTAAPGSPYQVGVFPSFVTLDPAGRFLYVSDANDYVQGLVHVMAVDQATGQLTAAGTPMPVGASPNRVTFSAAGRAFLSNYASWELMVFDVDTQDGSLTLAEKLPTRMDPESVAVMEGGSPYSAVPQLAFTAQRASNSISLFRIDATTGMLSASQNITVAAPDAVALGPNNTFLYALNTQAGTLSVLQVDAANGTLTLAPAGTFSVGADPRSLAFEPTKRFAYVLNGASGLVSQYGVDAATGAFNLVNTTSVGTAPTSMAIEPTGRYLYVSFQASARIKVYALDTGGTLALRFTMNLGGAGPSLLAADPTGRFVAALFPTLGEVRLYSIYAPMGDLTHATTAFPGVAPSALTFDPSGSFLLATDAAGSTLSAYAVNAATQQLQNTATVPTGAAPSFLAMDPSNRFIYVASPGSSEIRIYQLDAQTGTIQVVNTMVLVSASGVIHIR